MHYTDDAKIENIRDYLNRPQQLSAGSWSTTSNKFLYSTDALGSPMWLTHAHYPKVLGAFGIRAKTCFRLELVASPQHAGHLKLCFCPFEDDITRLTRSQVSQLPGVDVLLNNSTAAEFSVPFIHTKDFFHINATDEKLGSIALVDMSGLIAPPELGSITWSIYWWMEDVQLIGAMPASIGASYLNARNSILAKIQA